MFQIDKAQFGAFVAELRRERGLTQKELAEKLYISDKAVSKWETGTSLPDISLLTPLAEELGVTAAELLSSRRIDSGETMDGSQADTLLRRALELSPQEGLRRPGKRRVLTFIGLAALSAAEIAALVLLTEWRPGFCLLVPEIIGLMIGAYFFLAVKTRLPGYYDENKIDVYTDGFLRLHMSGLAMNNANWSCILRAFRGFAAVTLALWPPAAWCLERFTSPDSKLRLFATLAFTLGGLFIPAYAAGIRHRKG